MPESPDISAQLYRFLNGRCVSFDVDKLLPTFAPFHAGIADNDGTVPLRFSGFEDRYDLRLGADAVDRRVTLTIELRLPILAPGFWFCVHCLLRDDFVVLLSRSKRCAYYANESTPSHVPSSEFDFPSMLTFAASPDTLITAFVQGNEGG